ncbi:hypothetical protein ACH4U7_40695 [Streptomyces sp. NPDC020845]|uniref:hypothetical protein n=1 Tax=Streptomyces sp. NPDC020845 TaxID=3365096 RepID=UPI003797DA54
MVDYICSQGAFDLTPGTQQTLVLRVYQQGEPVMERDLFPYLRLRIPGFAEMGFNEDHEPIGGEPEPGSDAEGIDDPELLMDMAAEALIEHGEEAVVTVHWARLLLPTLRQPLLPEEAGIKLDGRDLRYGTNETLT